MLSLSEIAKLRYAFQTRMPETEVVNFALEPDNRYYDGFEEAFKLWEDMRAKQAVWQARDVATLSREAIR
jgi:hypothetical protein